MFIYVAKRITLAFCGNQTVGKKESETGYCNLQGREDGGSLNGGSRFK